MKNGVLNVYKEAGFTSHDVVAKLRGICGQKKSAIQVPWTRMRSGYFPYVWEMQRSCVTCLRERQRNMRRFCFWER